MDGLDLEIDALEYGVRERGRDLHGLEADSTVLAPLLLEGLDHLVGFLGPALHARPNALKMVDVGEDGLRKLLAKHRLHDVAALRPRCREPGPDRPPRDDDPVRLLQPRGDGIRRLAARGSGHDLGVELRRDSRLRHGRSGSNGRGSSTERFGKRSKLKRNSRRAVSGQKRTSAGASGTSRPESHSGPAVRPHPDVDSNRDAPAATRHAGARFGDHGYRAAEVRRGHLHGSVRAP